MNSFQNLVSKSADYHPGSNTCHQKCRCVYKHTCILYDQHGNDQLTDIMGNTSCNADTDQTEGGFFSISVITVILSAAPARLYRILNRFPNINPITRMRTTETRAASLNEYFFKIKSTPRLASPSLIPGIPAKTGTSDSTYPKIIATAEKAQGRLFLLHKSIFSSQKIQNGILRILQTF